jgi:hypothetical protein
MSRKPTGFIILLLGICMVIHVSLTGQSRNWKAGLMVGMNISNYDEGRFDKFDFFYPGAGYALGISTGYSLVKNLNLNIEALYTYRVAKEKYLEDDNPFYDFAISEFRVNQAFISMPVTLNYSFNRLNLQGGIFGDRRLTTEIVGTPTNKDLENFSFQKGFSGGLLLGGHYNFYNFEIGIRKFYGLTNLEKTIYSEGGIMKNIELYQTRNFQFYIIYNIL